jgi:hypothetical protein
MTATRAPIETKVIAGSSASAITGLITWALVTYVPAFHSGLPPSLAAVLPFAVATILGSISAYLAPHTPRAAVKAPEHAAR